MKEKTRRLKMRNLKSVLCILGLSITITFTLTHNGWAQRDKWYGESPYPIIPATKAYPETQTPSIELAPTPGSTPVKLPFLWKYWLSGWKADWLTDELFSGDATRIQNAQQAFGSLEKSQQLRVLLIMNKGGYPGQAATLLEGLDTPERNALYVDLAKQDPATASRMVTYWPEGVNEEVTGMFYALINDSPQTAAKVLGEIIKDPSIRDFETGAPAGILVAEPLFSNLSSADKIVLIPYLAKEDSCRTLLVNALNDPDPSVRQAAVPALGETKDPSVVPALIEVLKDEDPMVNAAARYALVIIGEPAVPALIEASKGDDYNLRVAARYTLIDIGPPAVPYLIKVLEDEGSYGNLGTICVLGEIGDPSAVPALIEALKKTPDYFMRTVIVATLGDIGDPSAVPVLKEALDDEELWVRTAARNSLDEIERLHPEIQP